MSNYYEILGIAKTASAGDIKQSYRKLAMEWHPDHHGGDKSAEAKFKEINEAYEVLKDPQKKANYDRFGTADPQHHQHYYRSADFSNINDELDELLKQFNFGGFSTRRRRLNPNLAATVNINLEDAYHGKEIDFELDDPSGKKKHYSIKIPPGVDSGLKLRLDGKGSHQYADLPPGDLILTIYVHQHNTFRRLKSDLLITKDITFTQAALSTEITVPTIDGRTVKVDIPAGTQPNQRIRLRGYGMPHIKNNDFKGDLYITINIPTPTNLSTRQKEILREFDSESKPQATI